MESLLHSNRTQIWWWRISITALDSPESVTDHQNRLATSLCSTSVPGSQRPTIWSLRGYSKPKTRRTTNQSFMSNWWSLSFRPLECASPTKVRNLINGQRNWLTSNISMCLWSHSAVGESHKNAKSKTYL